MKTKKGELVCVLANQVAEARHRLTVQEQRLVLWLISRIEPRDRDFLSHKLSVREFQSITGTNNGRLYEQMKATASGLLQRVLQVRTPGSVELPRDGADSPSIESAKDAGYSMLPGRGISSGVRFQWFSEVEYHDGAGTLTVRFHERLRPFLLELKSRFTTVALAQVFHLRSSYAIRFYELLRSRESLRRFEMTVEELRHWAGLEPGEMERLADMRRFVIEQARRELEAKADRSFDVEPIRSGRSITGFAFRVRKNVPRKRARKPASTPEEARQGEETRKQQRAELRALRESIASKPAAVPAKKTRKRGR